MVLKRWLLALDAGSVSLIVGPALLCDAVFFSREVM